MNSFMPIFKANAMELLPKLKSLNSPMLMAIRKVLALTGKI